MKSKLKGSICLLLTTLIWGSAFIAQSVGMDYIGPFTFQAIRCGLAVLFLIPVIFLFDLGKRDGHSFISRWKNAKLWKTGILCGCALFVAASLQQIGLQYTDAGKAGFITAMYIVLVPLCGLVLKKKPPVSSVFSVVIAVIGLYLLSCVGVSQINKGDLCLMGCALAFAVQITLIDVLAGDLDGLRLNCIQSLVCSFLSVPFMFLTETPSMSAILPCWLPICYAGILSSGVAYSLQIIGQKDMDPTAASLIMSLESVFAALFGWLLLHEVMNPTELCGCLLVFTAVVLSQLPENMFRKKKHS
ncbi:MAG: DMT family transporter [Oscillospiraceae bacterium]|nr:DMT family transporter [Oscillospiraceae bacterium]